VTIKVVGYSYEDCRKALEKMIILDELAFNFVENQGFKSFCQVMQPRFDVPRTFDDLERLFENLYS
jgi:hypothetical protein